MYYLSVMTIKIDIKNNTNNYKKQIVEWSRDGSAKKYTNKIPYSRKIWRGIKVGGLAVRAYNRQIKARQYFLHAYIRMAILYRTAKFKSANISLELILGDPPNLISAKFSGYTVVRDDPY